LGKNIVFVSKSMLLEAPTDGLQQINGLTKHFGPTGLAKKNKLLELQLIWRILDTPQGKTNGIFYS
jgi:hypothetical protein